MCTKTDGKPQKTTEQIVNRIEKRQLDLHFQLDKPHLVVFASPLCFGTRLISVDAIDKYMFESKVIPCGTRHHVGKRSFTSKKVEEGVWCIREDNLNFFWELNEYGIIYNREWVIPETLTKNEGDSTELYLPSHDILTQICNFIRAAIGFYQRCRNADNIKIKVQLRQVYGQKLKFKDLEFDRADATIRRSSKSKISATMQCLPHNLKESVEFEKVLFRLADRLVQEFNQQQSSQELWREMKGKWRVQSVCDE